VIAAREVLRPLAVAAPPALAFTALAFWPGFTSFASPLVVLGGALALSALFAARERAYLARRLRTVSSVLAAYRDGDLSIRARAASADRLLADVLTETNALGDALREHRLGEMEAWLLLRKVLSEVDVAILAVHESGKIRLANGAAAHAVGRGAAVLQGQDAHALGLAPLLEGDVPRIVKEPFGPGSAGTWELRRGDFRLGGEPHTLLVLSDVGDALRENEREAWHRIVRVMGHEINNTLTPIQSISESLLARARALAGGTPADDEWSKDLDDGLALVARRAAALARFMGAYARLARLPPPTLAAVEVQPLAEKVRSLEPRIKVDVAPGPRAFVRADPDQLEQVLINLVKNAADAVLEARAKAPVEDATAIGVRISWTTDERTVVLRVEDDGVGVAAATNLFVPFFTTKTGGSGIGLALSLQIVEAHRGRLALAPRKDARGAVATVELPVA
jgi:nitrogen fixation/metabolism regulation signal transduction histidine kinase